jgi:hypothetical protein
MTFLIRHFINSTKILEIINFAARKQSRTWGLGVCSRQNCRQRSGPMASRPEQSPVNEALQLPTADRSASRLCSERISQTCPTAVCGPVRTVVWQERRREAPPIPINLRATSSESADSEAPGRRRSSGGCSVRGRMEPRSLMRTHPLARCCAAASIAVAHAVIAGRAGQDQRSAHEPGQC